VDRLSISQTLLDFVLEGNLGLGANFPGKSTRAKAPTTIRISRRRHEISLGLNVKTDRASVQRMKLMAVACIIRGLRLATSRLGPTVLLIICHSAIETINVIFICFSNLSITLQPPNKTMIAIGVWALYPIRLGDIFPPKKILGPLPRSVLLEARGRNHTGVFHCCTVLIQALVDTLEQELQPMPCMYNEVQIGFCLLGFPLFLLAPSGSRKYRRIAGSSVSNVTRTSGATHETRTVYSCAIRDAAPHLTKTELDWGPEGLAGAQRRL
jgi:hypothetical protein